MKYSDRKKGALSGIRVIDLTRVLAGPFASMLLGDLGAGAVFFLVRGVNALGLYATKFVWPLGLDVNYFMSSDDYVSPYAANDFAPMVIFGDNINNGLADVTYATVKASYSVNDKLSVWAAALVQAEDDAGDKYGNEFDLGLNYKFADNIIWMVKYGSYSEGDDPVNNADDADLDTTELFHRIEFKF